MGSFKICKGIDQVVMWRGVGPADSGNLSQPEDFSLARYAGYPLNGSEPRKFGKMDMNQIEETVDAVLSECVSRKLRLWLGNFRDLQIDLGQWSGLIFLRAQAYPGEWQPDRAALLTSVQDEHETDGIGLSADAVTASLLAQARRQFAADLVTKGVPRELAKRAGEILSFNPPIQQWRL